MNSFSPEFLRQIEMLEHVRSEIPVPTLPLAEILGRHLPPGQAIKLCAQNVIILDKINEYFLIDRTNKRQRSSDET